MDGSAQLEDDQEETTDSDILETSRYDSASEANFLGKSMEESGFEGFSLELRRSECSNEGQPPKPFDGRNGCSMFGVAWYI